MTLLKTKKAVSILEAASLNYFSLTFTLFQHVRNVKSHITNSETLPYF
jgi:hypothetical protein